MIALEQKKEFVQDKPRVMERGHLALLDWEDPAKQETVKALPVRYSDPVKRSPFDRLMEQGLVLLVISTIGAVCACLAHL